MKKLLSIALIAILLYSCSSSTSIVSSWKPENSQPVKMQKVLVVGLMGYAERELRENTEITVAQMLTDNGINAVAAIKALGVPPKDPKENKKMIETELKENGYDGVMLISLIDKEKDINVNGNGGYPGWGYNPFWGYNGMNNNISVVTKYAVEANLYTVTPEKLVYSVLTNNYESKKPAVLAQKFAESILKDMQKQGLVTTPAKK